MVSARQFLISITYVIAAAVTAVGPACAAAGGLRIERDAEAVTLTYARSFGTCMQVEMSTDLTHWVSVATVDAVMDALPNGQVIASRVPHLGAVQMFFRLFPIPAHDVTLTWDSVPDAGVFGYRLHYRTRSEAYEHVLDVGLATVVTVSLPNGDRVYSFSATAYAANGLESEPSASVNVLLR